MNDDFNNDSQSYTFIFTDFDGVSANISRFTDNGFSWPDVVLDVVSVLEKQFGYEIAEEIIVKGTALSKLREDRYALIKPLQRLREIDEELGLFPETSAGLTD